MSPPSIRPGTYRHFKGNLYQVYGIAHRVDAPELYVVYRPLYGDRELVLREYTEFTGTVIRDGKEIKRFEFLEPDSPLGIDDRDRDTRITHSHGNTLPLTSG